MVIASQVRTPVKAACQILSRLIELNANVSTQHCI